LVQIHAKRYQFQTQTFEIKVCTICIHIMLSIIIKIKDIYQCEDTYHVYAAVRTGPWGPIWSVRATWCPQAPCW